MVRRELSLILSTLVACMAGCATFVFVSLAVSGSDECGRTTVKATLRDSHKLPYHSDGGAVRAGPGIDLSNRLVVVYSLTSEVAGRSEWKKIWRINSLSLVTYSGVPLPADPTTDALQIAFLQSMFPSDQYDAAYYLTNQQRVTYDWVGLATALSSSALPANAIAAVVVGIVVFGGIAARRHVCNRHPIATSGSVSDCP